MAGGKSLWQPSHFTNQSQSRTADTFYSIFSKEMLCFVYVLGSRRKNDRRTYVGWTTDLKRRLQQHNAGLGAKSTRGRKWILLYFECCKARSEAMSREWHIKRDRNFRASLREAIRT
jgi:putative endonuclease